MVSHWLGTRPNGYLGSGYGAGVEDLLQTPQAAGGADALIAKLREDITIMGQLPSDSLNVFAEQRAPDGLLLYVEVAGNFVRIDGVAATAGA